MRRRNRQAIEPETPRKVPKPLLIFAIVLALISSLFLFITRDTSQTRTNIAVPGPEESVYILSFEHNGLTSIHIPGNTVIHTAGNLGDWPARSLWKLGHNEGVKGALMSRSLTKTFSLPVTDWAGSEAYGFTKGGIASLKLIFTPFETSLTFGERIRLAFASSRIDPANKRVVNLVTLNILSLDKDESGEPIYNVRERTPVGILKLFDEALFSAEGVTIGIEDGVQDGYVASELSRLLTVIGGKVVSIEKKEIPDTCTISARGEYASFLAKVLPCTIDKTDPKPFDIKIRIGAEFTKLM